MVEDNSKKRRSGEPAVIVDVIGERCLTESPSKLRGTDTEEKSQQHAQIIDEEKAFEDPYGDEFEEEEFVYNDDEDEDGDKDQQDEEAVEEQELLPRPWRHGVDPIGEDEELEYDPRAYDLYHRAMLSWSCLSFDILPDQLGNNRESYPHTVYVVAGTQAEKKNENRIFMMKWKNLTKTRHRKDDADDDDADESSDDDPDDDGNPDEEPVLDFRGNHHAGTVNRIRCCPQLPRLVASWSETGKIYMWDLKEHLERLDEPGNIPNNRTEPKFTFSGHREEGFAMAFNPHKTGMLATGSCDSTIRLWNPIEGGWSVEKPILSHGGSVEDIQWRKLGHGAGDVFASCGGDGSIRLFDLSTSVSKPQLIIPDAHQTTDVNVVSWSPFQEDFLLSGGDDGSARVWDMRNTSEPIVHLHYHRKAISSVDWHPTDPATFACASLDDSISLWDMSVEADTQLVPGNTVITTDLPDQLMFQHLGQTHITEIQWQPQIPGILISTAEDGFNIFKTFNV